MLKDITLLPIYDSAENDIINDLIVPALSQSVEYWRGVGFFTSGWLKLTAIGVEKLIKNGGTAKFIISPILNKEDVQAFNLAEEAKDNEVFRETLKRNLDEISYGLEHETLNFFAWLLADGLLDFKFAIPRTCTEGDYHDKVGFCIDRNGDMIAFHGSFNDTYKGSLNGEAFSVFKSWVNGQIIYAQKHAHRLRTLWEHGNNQFSVLPFYESVKLDFINMRSSQRPYSLLHKKNVPIPPSIEKLSHEVCIPYKLKPYQDEAIKAWFLNDGCGIFEMATGTGKTITSLAAAVMLFKKQKKIFLVIVVPYLHLMEQWGENCQLFNMQTVYCSSINSKWESNLNSLIMSYRLGNTDFACVIVLKDTACKSSFKKYVAKISTDNFMMIADETHYLGAKYLRAALFPEANFRLGLSATPSRWMDEEGTNVLNEYYNGTVYSFSLEQAIGKFLTEYEYHPILVELTQDELNDYSILTNEIARLFALIKKGENTAENEMMLGRKRIARARLIGKAENKIPDYQKLLHSLKSHDKALKHLLVFCAPGTHKEILQLTSQTGIKSHEFVSEVDAKTRKAVLKAFDSGEIEAIISIKCMDEGVDVPATDLAVFLASTTNPKEFIQRRGRVLRKCEGKTRAIIYDFIVIPPNGTSIEIAASIIKRELPRFAEFADAAINKYVARQIIMPELEKYGLQMYIDLKPWDIYKEELLKGEE